MKWYRCLISGENFPGELIGEKKLIGFYTTRFIEACDPEEAEKLGLLKLRSEESLKLPEGVKPTKEAKVYFEEIEEVSKDAVPETQIGFSFYAMDT